MTWHLTTEAEYEYECKILASTVIISNGPFRIQVNSGDLHLTNIWLSDDLDDSL